LKKYKDTENEKLRKAVLKKAADAVVKSRDVLEDSSNILLTTRNKETRRELGEGGKNNQYWKRMKGKRRKRARTSIISSQNRCGV